MKFKNRKIIGLISETNTQFSEKNASIGLLKLFTERKSFFFNSILALRKETLNEWMKMDE